MLYFVRTRREVVSRSSDIKRITMNGKFFLASLVLLASVLSIQADPKVLCYYDSKSHLREGQGKMQPIDLETALPFCTHLIYGHAGINKDTHKMVPLNENFDITKGNYKALTDLKRRFPLRILLSVGGGEDDENMEKYMELIETAEHRITFINSAVTMLKAYGFDGLDLGWEFPTNKPKKLRGTFSSLWHGFKKKIGVGKGKVDDKEEEHREQYTAFIREMKNAFKHDGLLLSMSVLPNVNSTIYYDAKALCPNLDWVNIEAFDFQTPKRNPKEADYPAPLYSLLDRHPHNNIDALVSYWLEHGCAANKIIIGVPAFARTWKMTEDSAISGVPPFTTDGPAQEGPYSKHEGLLSYPEVCTQINRPVSAKGAEKKLRKVGDPSKRYDDWVYSDRDVTKRYGTYAFRLPDESGEYGMWAGYEDPDTVGNKASYVKAKGLAGMAVHDLSLDDFRGLCSGDKYPILRAAKSRL